MGRALAEDVTNSLAAYYWDGAAPLPHRVRNLSAYGANIITTEKWLPGTVIQLTLQHGEHVNATGDKAGAPAVSVRTRVVAQDADGVRVAFVCLNKQERNVLRRFLQDIERAELSVSPRRMSASSGQSLIEFALILPLIVLLVVNVVNFGSFLYTWITVSNAARAGAQYMILAGASLGTPREATANQITSLVQADLASLTNAAAATVTVCTNNNGTFEPISGGTGGGCSTSCNGAVCTDPEGGTYVLATVDVTYNWTPPISGWEFPALHIHATLPYTTIHRTAVMRMIQ